jgi:outer membrane receptor protein involved in Fe transport
MAKAKPTDPAAFNGISYSTTIGAAVAAAVGAGPALAQQSGGIEEVVVTATKRGEISIMDIAGSIQAFDTESIRNQNLFSMEDYSKFTPSISYFGNQTGQGKIFFRGIADAPDTFIVSQSAAVYLDEQPITMGAAVDVRLVDIKRVEALSGPQGTLYGSSSQSGTLRIVTNKPDPTKFEAFADVSLKGMSEGDNSFDFSGMVNIPLAEDQFAIRLVGFSATEGGFIDNVLGTTGNCEFYGRCSVDGPQMNTGAVEKDWNETTISGGRVSAKWFINDDWSATVGIANQQVDSDAENTYDPTIGDLELIAFNPDTFDDEWTQFAFTLEGEIGNFGFTSATAYFTRDYTYSQDTTEYAAYFGQWCYWWTATYNIYCFQPAGVSYYYNDPVGYLVNNQENTAFSQEFRLSFSNDRMNWVGGIFYEERTEEWDFDTFTDGYRGSQAFDNWVRPSGLHQLYWYDNGTAYFYYVTDGWGVPAGATDSWWFSADDTDWETLAVFTEATFHIGDKFSLTAGARWFEVEQTKRYYVELPHGRLTPGSGQLDPDRPVGKWGCLYNQGPCNDYDSDNPLDGGINFMNSTDDDIAVKLALQYDVTEDIMIYGLFSEGFRAGGVNRNRGVPRLPQAYGADFLKNYEFGLKGSFADGRLNVSTQVFFQDWEDYQVEVVDPSSGTCGDIEWPCGQPWQKGVLNAGNAHSDGVEIQIEALPTDRLSLRFNATFLESEIDEDIPGLDDVGKGSKLPFAPNFKGSMYAQYNFPMNVAGSQEGFFQFQFSHVGDSLNQVQAIPIVPIDELELTVSGGGTPQMKQEAYNYASVKFGLLGDDWEANLFINNLTDERGQLYHDITDFEPFFGRQRTSVIRPREYGIRFFKRWGE